MKRLLTGGLLTAAVLFAGFVRAQEKMPEMTPAQKAEMEAYMKAGTPGAPHQRLSAQSGTYDIKIKAWHEPGTPPTEDLGTAIRSMLLGDRVQLEELTTTMMGMPYSGHGMTGYDNGTKKYWATWNDNMSTGLMVSEGTCDDQGACTFTGTWNDPVTKKVARYRMMSKWTSPTTEIFTMYGPDRKGKDYKMMEITYTKK